MLGGDVATAQWGLSLQWIGRRGHDAWALGAVDPHQRIFFANIELFADCGCPMIVDGKLSLIILYIQDGMD